MPMSTSRLFWLFLVFIWEYARMNWLKSTLPTPPGLCASEVYVPTPDWNFWSFLGYSMNLIIKIINFLRPFQGFLFLTRLPGTSAHSTMKCGVCVCKRNTPHLRWGPWKFGASLIPCNMLSEHTPSKGRDCGSSCCPWQPRTKGWRLGSV